MSGKDRRAWDRETLASAAVLTAAIVTLLIGAFEVRDQNAVQAGEAAKAVCSVES